MNTKKTTLDRTPEDFAGVLSDMRGHLETMTALAARLHSQDVDGMSSMTEDDLDAALGNFARECELLRREIAMLEHDAAPKGDDDHEEARQ